MSELLPLLASLLLITACALFVAGEFSFITADKQKLRALADTGDQGAAGVLSALRNLSSQLSGAQIGITITSLLIGLLAEPAMAHLIERPLAGLGIHGDLSHTLAFIVAVTTATIVTMIFGELVPKNLAIARPIATAKLVQLPLRLFSRIMSGPIRGLNSLANLALKRLDITPTEELASARSAEELLSVVRHSARRGSLSEETAEMLERTLEFDDKIVADILTPRVNMHTVAATDNLLNVIDRVQDSGHSRFPVTGKDIDDVTGIVLAKTIMRTPFKKRATTPVQAIMKTPVFVPASVPLGSLLDKFQENNTEIAVVLDEFGGTEGLVTTEDLIEELVGDVRDEHDGRGQTVRKLDTSSWLVSALLRPDEIDEATGLRLPEDEDFETLGGLLLDRFETVPAIDDSVDIVAIDNHGNEVPLRLTVRSLRGRGIERIVMKRLASTKPEPGAVP